MVTAVDDELFVVAAVEEELFVVAVVDEKLSVVTVLVSAATTLMVPVIDPWNWQKNPIELASAGAVHSTEPELPLLSVIVNSSVAVKMWEAPPSFDTSNKISSPASTSMVEGEKAKPDIVT